MAPAKRRPPTPASQGPTRTAPDVPVVADPTPVPPAEAKGEDASAGSAPQTETGPVDAGDRARPSPPRRPLALYPLPVWPD